MESLISVVIAAVMGAAAATTPAPEPTAAPAKVSLRTIATGLEVPWGIAFLPDGDALVAERTTGRILRIPREGGGKPRRSRRVPGVDTNAGEGGLLGLAVSPRYASDKLVYAYYTARGGQPHRRASGSAAGASDPSSPACGAASSTTAAGSPSGPTASSTPASATSGRPRLAQDRDSLNGKILRMNPNGSVPADNPFRARSSSRSATATCRGWRGTRGPPVGDRVRPEHASTRST